MTKVDERVKITVRYWRGTMQLTGMATTYAGAMRIASRNQNAYDPTFWDGHRRLLDDGRGLVYEDTINNARLTYAV